MNIIGEGGQFVDPQRTPFVVGRDLVHGRNETGQIETHMTQSQAGLGTQGAPIPHPHTTKIPAPTHDEMPDG